MHASATATCGEDVRRCGPPTRPGAYRGSACPVSWRLVLARWLHGLSSRPWAPLHACTRPFAPGRRASGGRSTRPAAPTWGQLAWRSAHPGAPAVPGHHPMAGRPQQCGLQPCLLGQCAWIAVGFIRRSRTPHEHGSRTGRAAARTASGLLATGRRPGSASAPGRAGRRRLQLSRQDTLRCGFHRVWSALAHEIARWQLLVPRACKVARPARASAPRFRPPGAQAARVRAGLPGSPLAVRAARRLAKPATSLSKVRARVFGLDDVLLHLRRHCAAPSPSARRSYHMTCACCAGAASGPWRRPAELAVQGFTPCMPGSRLCGRWRRSPRRLSLHVHAACDSRALAAPLL